MKINASGIVKGLQNEDLQMIAGAYFYASKQFHDGAIDGSLRMLDALIKDPHVPNIEHVIADLRNSGIIKDLIKLGIGGWIASELKIHPKLTKAGNIAKSFAVNGGIGVAVISGIRHASLAHSPAPSSSNFRSGNVGGNPYSQELY